MFTVRKLTRPKATTYNRLLQKKMRYCAFFTDMVRGILRKSVLVADFLELDLQ